jgi:hypothetical protein
MGILELAAVRSGYCPLLVTVIYLIALQMLKMSPPTNIPASLTNLSLTTVGMSAILLASLPASAATLGTFSGSWDGTEPTQIGRLTRDGTPSDGNITPAKTFPGIFGGSSRYLYEIFQFSNNGAANLITVNATISGDFNSFLTAYSGSSYDPIVVTNSGIYLGDLGFSETGVFSFIAPANSQFFIVANNVFSGNTTGTFSFTVDNTAAVPEPFTIIGTIVGGTAALRLSKRLKNTDKI